jgi:hypothetical protein
VRLRALRGSHGDGPMTYDVLAIGRSSIDLYAHEIGARSPTSAASTPTSAAARPTSASARAGSVCARRC